ncbi:MAG: PAS domain S-box protein [Deltaproteobacteria bacterium]|nr:PAS domain S-box protein [Deltaproteobacteria bacterium]
MPDVAYTAERDRIFAFHRTQVLSSWFQVYARQGSGIKSIMDLAGKRIVVLERSVQEEAFSQMTNEFGLNSKLIPLPDYKDSFKYVADGKADAAITNRFYGLMHARKFGLEDTAIIFAPSNLFFAAPAQGRQPLLNAIDTHLSRLTRDSDSIYYQSLNRWTAEKVPYILPAWVMMAGLIVGGGLLLSLAVSILLKRQVTARTRALSEQNEKMIVMNRTLSEEERKYRELLEHANSIILHWTRDGQITFMNEFGQRFFGYSEADIVGRHVVGTIVPETERDGRDLRPLMDRICADPEAFEQNVNENIRCNGERVWIAWTNKVYFDDQGGITGILSIGSDITERKRVEEELRLLNRELEQRVFRRTAALAEALEKAQAADQVKSAFLATMSHELRTPLNSIIGFTGILLQGLPGPLNEEQQKQMRMVQNSSRHLLALINDVLDISKIEAGQLSLSITTFDLRVSIQKMVESVSPQIIQKGIELKLDIADDVHSATSDQRRIEQIILNLLNNAVKFTESGHVGLLCRRDTGHYVLSVSDTGIGIRAEEIPGLFQPFHQIDTGLARKHEGTGLGLSICHKLIVMLGGTIEVKSQWGTGSTFTIRFPIQTGEMS